MTPDLVWNRRSRSYIERTGDAEGDDWRRVGVVVGVIRFVPV